MIANEVIQFSERLQQETESIINKINGSEKEKTSDIFEDKIVFSSFPQKEDLRKALSGKKGVYLFRITEDCELTKEQVKAWNDEWGSKFSVLSGVRNISLKKCDFLYIGSCYSESIYTRVQAHYSYNYKSGLQLNTKGRQILKDKVALYAFPIKKEYYKTKEEGLFAKCILPIVEKMLDNRLKPKAGSTRT